jgi:hypothetical protein
VTAGENQPEPLVGHDMSLVGLDGFEDTDIRQQGGNSGEVLASAELIDSFAAGDRQQPSGRMIGNSVSGPRSQSSGHSILEGLLGEVEVTKEPDERSEHQPMLFPEDAV